MTSTDHPPVLFLDFDGVLHPTGTAPQGLFAHMPLLAEGLRGPLAAVQVVISSDWRLSFTFDELRPDFPDDLRPRVVGCTADEGQVTVLGWGAVAVNHPRHAQILAWLVRHRGGLQHPSAALDDRPEWFLPAKPRLVQVAPEHELHPKHLVRVQAVLGR